MTKADLFISTLAGVGFVVVVLFVAASLGIGHFQFSYTKERLVCAPKVTP